MDNFMYYYIGNHVLDRWYFLKEDIGSKVRNQRCLFLNGGDNYD